MAVKQISVFLENKPGALMTVTDVLARHNIDMRALSLAETTDFGIARLIVDDVFATATVLRDAGFVYNMIPVVAVNIPDEPGGLNRILGLFADANINVEYMYAFIGGKADRAYMIFRVQDDQKADAVLRENGIESASQEEISAI